jgi:malonyl-CoA O-methyltransferase
MDASRIDGRRVRQAFQRAADSYDAAAVLQHEIADRMLERLDYIKLAPKILLDAGCGTGYALGPLRRRYPQASAVALDIAPAMLAHARGDLTFTDRLSAALFGRSSRGTILPVCADVARLPLRPASLDMIWSNLAVQWCDDLPQVFTEFRHALAVDGLLMFSTFGPDTLKEMRAAFAEVDGHTHVSRFIDMHDIGDMLVHAGFGDPVMDMEIITLTYDQVEDAMRDLKAIGAHNATLGRARGLTGKSRWQRLRAAYERYRREGKLPATFEVVYGHAWKPEPRVADDGRAIVHFDRRK